MEKLDRSGRERARLTGEVGGTATPGRRTLVEQLEPATPAASHVGPIAAPAASGDRSLPGTSGGPGASGGLPPATRATLEQLFGANFSGVRIHTNSARASGMGVGAFATGDDLHFAPREYNPDSSAGRKLIGHELAHVIQQRQGRVPARESGGAGPSPSQPQAEGSSRPSEGARERGSHDELDVDPALEQEADAIGERIANDEPVATGDGTSHGTAIQGSSHKRKRDGGQPVRSTQDDGQARTLDSDPTGGSTNDERGQGHGSGAQTVKKKRRPSGAQRKKRRKEKQRQAAAADTLPSMSPDDENETAGEKNRDKNNKQNKGKERGKAVEKKTKEEMVVVDEEEEEEEEEGGTPANAEKPAAENRQNKGKEKDKAVEEKTKGEEVVVDEEEKEGGTPGNAEKPAAEEKGKEKEKENEKAEEEGSAADEGATKQNETGNKEQPKPLAAISLVLDSNALAAINAIHGGVPWAQLQTHHKAVIDCLRQRASPKLPPITEETYSSTVTSPTGEKEPPSSLEQGSAPSGGRALNDVEQILGKGHDLRAAARTIEELQHKRNPHQGSYEGFSTTQGKDSEQYRDVLATLAKDPAIGGGNGDSDRRIVADVLFSEGVSKPTFVTADWHIYVPLYERFGANLGKLQVGGRFPTKRAQIVKNYGHGFTVNIPVGKGGNRQLLVVPIEGEGKRKNRSRNNKKQQQSSVD
jgi:hypothetical protein